MLFRSGHAGREQGDWTLGNASTADEACRAETRRALPARVDASGFVDADDVVRLEFVRGFAVTDTRDHARERVGFLDEVFRADRVEETLADGDFAELHFMTAGDRAHCADKGVRLENGWSIVRFSAAFA